MKTSKVKPENYITVQGWMVTELGLKGNELIIYACIFGFSQADDQKYSGSLQYLADWTNSTKRGVMNALKSLTEKALLEKTETFINGVKFCSYRVTKFTGVWNKVHGGMEQSSMGGMEQSSPNNIDLDNKENTIEKKIGDAPTPKPKKRKHGEYEHVMLTDEEVEKLANEYGTEKANDAIRYLDEYIEMKGYKAKSHYLAIRKWVMDALKEREQKQTRQQYGQQPKHGSIYGRKISEMGYNQPNKDPLSLDVDSLNL